MRDGPQTPTIVRLAMIMGEIIAAIIVLEALGRLLQGPASRRPLRSASVARARMLADPALSKRAASRAPVQAQP